MIAWFSRKKKTHIVHPAKKGSDDFVSLSSHELRSPLSVIKWYTEILLDEDAGKLTDDQRKYLTLIESSNQRAIDLIRALLNVSRVDLGTFSISPEEVRISESISEAMLTFSPLIEKKKLAIHVTDQAHIETLLLDKHITTFVIKGLLSNAILYSHENGAIEVTLSKVRAGGKFLSTAILDESLIIAVTDTGIGIMKEEYEKIGNKMFRGSNISDVSGSGLSLATIKALMSKIHGRFGFVSEEGKGSTFFVAFPCKGMEPKKGKTTLE